MLAYDSVINALSLSDVQSDKNLILVTEVVVELILLTDKRFTVDACCGVNSHCSEFCSPSKSFLSSDVCGQHVWLHPPCGRIDRFLKHDVQGKAKSPANTSACILVPADQTAKWRKLLSGTTLLKQYSKGFMLFAQAGSGANAKAIGPSPWHIEIWYDPPSADKQPEPVAEMTLHAVLQLGIAFAGLVAGVPACVLVDSGANRNFIDHALVVQHGLQEEYPTHAELCGSEGCACA